LKVLPADYAALIAQLLNIAIEVRRYGHPRRGDQPSRVGAVDLACSANG
jgi:two-component system sensor histidine kinase EvgS